MCKIATLPLLALSIALRAQQPVGGIVAIVNDSVITYGDVARYIAPIIQSIARQYADQPDQLRQKILQAQKDAVDQLIERALILQEFRSAGYSIADYVVEQEVKRRIQEQFAGDRVALIRTLQADGLTFDQWKQKVREELIISAMRAKYMGGEIVVSPHAIERYYVEHLDEFKLGDQVKIRTLMIDIAKHGGREFAYQLAQELAAKLKDGIPFEELARVYSDEFFASKGGDRGWISKDQIRKELAEVAFALQPGQVSPLVETPGAFWIIKVEAVRRNYVRTLPEVRSEIEAKLKQEERQRRYEQWIQTLKKKAFIRYF